MSSIVVGTAKGLVELVEGARREEEQLAGREITALALDAGDLWLLVEGRSVLRRRRGGPVEEVARIDGPAATCLAATPAGLLVGTEEARLLLVDDGRVAPVEAFEHAAGRADWYTPWGDPAAVRSLAAGVDGTLLVNVHVGGIVRSTDGGRTWQPTVDVDADVHQVLAHPARAGVAVAAAAIGLGVSTDGGATWRFVTEGLHAHYARAVALTDRDVLVSVSTGPGGRRSALYRARLEDGGVGPLERCRDGLPDWFGDNVDTGCLAARGELCVAGTEDGRVFRSDDGGTRWTDVARGLPAVRAVVLDG